MPPTGRKLVFPCDTMEPMTVEPTTGQVGASRSRCESTLPRSTSNSMCPSAFTERMRARAGFASSHPNDHMTAGNRHESWTGVLKACPQVPVVRHVHEVDSEVVVAHQKASVSPGYLRGSPAGLGIASSKHRSKRTIVSSDRSARTSVKCGCSNVASRAKPAARRRPNVESRMRR
jgi:hypothetical protein